MTVGIDRFKPSRAGVINLWDYADEEFAFADGRLVLRGHNGSGKTKALEVLFPFILDGVADARRLDPFSGENRTMKSNLLYRGQEAEYGYVWMEFARSTPDTETTETVTLIIGIRAHKNRDGVRTSFFVTDRRLGVDFGLLAADSRPLTETQLKAVLGRDTYSQTATDYRDMVDSRLFGLGPGRYTQLLDLLLALRRPLLAKDLDPGKVSATLTSGLSPVEEDLADQAARDFENLAAVQKQFDDFTTADHAVRAFLVDYTRYLRAHTKAKLTRVQEATKAAVGHAGALSGAARELARAGRAYDEAVQSRDRAHTEKNGLERRIAVLEKDDAYQAQGEVELQRRQIVKAGEEIVTEVARLAHGAEHLEALDQEAGDLADRLENTRRASVRLATELAAAAERAGITHDGDGPADTGADMLATAQSRSLARQDDIAEVRRHLALVDIAEADRLRTEQARDKAEKTVQDRDKQRQDADAALDEARAAARGDLARWAGRWAGAEGSVAGPSDVEALDRALDGLGQADAKSLAEVFIERSEDRRLRAAASVERLKGQASQLGALLERLNKERDEISAQRDDAPPADNRRLADREGLPGGPLWRLVRFADDITPDNAAGIEGALYGSGLLTAWVHSDPALTHAAVEAGEADGYLLAASSDRCPPGRSLADVLVPEDQDLVAADVVVAVLRSIALSDELLAGVQAPVITARAQFSYGIHLGARPKPSPEYIGATNRANRRKARLAEYDTQITEADRRHDAVTQDLERTNDLLEALGQARKDLPRTKQILEALRRVAHQSTLLAEARAVWDDQQHAFDAAAAEVDATHRRLRQLAAERAMPSLVDAVDAVARAVDDFATAARDLHTSREQAETADKDLAARQAAISRQRSQYKIDTVALRTKEGDHALDREELAGREQALDAPLREVLAQIEEIGRRLKAVRTEYQEQAERAAQEHDAVIRAENDLQHGRDSLGEAMGHLFEHVGSFAPYAHGDLRVPLGVATTRPWPAEVGWPAPEEAAKSMAEALTDASLDPAAMVNRALSADVTELLDTFHTEMVKAPAVSENLLKNSASQMSAALRTFQDALDTCTEDYRLDHDPSGVLLVYVNDEGGRNPVAAFARRIADRVEEQGLLLEERERTVLEDELLTGLAQQIHDRVRTARDLVKGMNDDTRSRPMSSGTRIGIRWGRSDKITDKQLDASRLLDRDVPGLGPTGLAELRGLLREMIRHYRAGSPRATYKQALADVLDYRAWYAFELVLAVPGEKEVKLTKAKHEEMSGGEKSAAIHLPLFAAANSLYSSADLACPRMIALDEAFAGIDDRYKPELLGLTVKFDLDLFMTGHDLWVHYDTVPMAAHYDMHHDKSAHAVSAMLMLWDGMQTFDADAGFAGNEELATTLLGIVPSRRAPASLEGTLLAALPGDLDFDEGDDDA